MLKEIFYIYIGENGTIISPVKLIGEPKWTRYSLHADKNKKLTKDSKTFVTTVNIPASEVDEWYEVDA